MRYVPLEVAVIFDECRRTIGRILVLVLEFQTELRMVDFFGVLIGLLNKRREMMAPNSVGQHLNHSGLAMKPRSGFSRSSPAKQSPSKIHPMQSSHTKLLLPSSEVIISEDALIDRCVNILSELLNDSMGINFNRGDNFNLIIKNSKNIEDISLKTELLHLMNRIHTQSLYFREVYSNVLFVHPGKRKDEIVAKDAMEKLINISMNVTKWYDEENPKEVRDILEILVDLENSINIPIRVCRFSKYVENTADLTTEQVSDKIRKKNENIYDLYLSFKNNKSNLAMQDIIRNVGVFQQVVKILDYDLNYNFYVEDKRHHDLIRKIYQFFIVSCRNNEVNKIYFAGFEKLFFDHIQIEASEGAYILLDNILPRCKESISDPDKFEYILGLLSNMVTRYSSLDASKPILMSCIMSLLYLQGTPIKHNQNRVINTLFKKKDEEILGDNFKAPDFKTRLMNEFSNFTIKFDGKNGKYLVINSSYINYIVSIINTLTACGEGMNSYSENYAQTVLDLELLYSILNLRKLDFILKCAIVHFFFDIYIEIENESPILMKSTFLKIVKILLIELDDVSDTFTKKGSQIYPDYPSLTLASTEFMTFNGVKSAEEVYRMYAITLADCFTTLANRDNKTSSTRVDRNSKGMAEVLNQITGVSRKFNEVYDDEVKLSLEKLREACINYEEPEDAIVKDATNILKISQAKNFHAATIISRYVDVKECDVEDKQLDGPELILSEAYRIVYKIFNSSKFSIVIEKEFEKWISIINQLEDSGEKETSIFIDFLKDTVTYFNTNMNTIDENLTLTGIKLFRKFIESITGNETLTAINWDSIIYEKFKSKIIRRQNFLLETSIVEWMCNILTQNRSKMLFQDSLLLCIALLFGGNYKCQQQFYDEISRQVETNKLLINLNNVFAERFSEISIKMKAANDQKVRKILNEKQEEKTFSKEDKELLRKVGSTVSNLLVNTNGLNIETNIFRFLQLLCEGHNENLQNLLREQYPGIKSLVHIKNVNFIANASKYIGQLMKFVNPECVSLGLQMIDFLIEAVQGPCQLNQKMLFETKVVEVVKDFMHDLMVQRDYFDQMFGSHQQDLSRLVKKSISLLNSVVEANRDPKMVNFMAQNLNVEFLVQCLKKEFMQFLKKHPKYDEKKRNTTEVLEILETKRTWNEDDCEGFNIYFLLQMLASSSPSMIRELNILREANEDVFGFYKKYSGQVEIVFEEKLITYYFVIHPACFNLDSNTKTAVLNSVRLDSPSEKITDFMDSVPLLFDQMDDKAYMRSWRIQLNPNLYRMTRLATLINTIIINLIMFIQFGKRAQNNNSITNPEFDENQMTFQILAITHNFASLFLIVYWFLLESRLANAKGWRKLLKEWRKEVLTSNSRLIDSEIDQQAIQSFSKNFARLTNSEKYQLIKYRNELKGFHGSYYRMDYWVRSLCIIFNDSTLVFLIRFLLVSILGLYFQTQGFLFGYSILMLDAIFWSDTMKNVIKSITYGGAQFVLTAVLGRL